MSEKTLYYILGALLFLALVALAIQVLGAKDASVDAPRQNLEWMSFRDAQTVLGQKDCVGEKVLEDGPNKGKYKYTCTLVPGHTYYTDHRDVAPGDWIPDSPYVRAAPDKPAADH